MCMWYNCSPLAPVGFRCYALHLDLLQTCLLVWASACRGQLLLSVTLCSHTVDLSFWPCGRPLCMYVSFAYLSVPAPLFQSFLMRTSFSIWKYLSTKLKRLAEQIVIRSDYWCVIVSEETHKTRKCVLHGSCWINDASKLCVYCWLIIPFTVIVRPIYCLRPTAWSMSADLVSHWEAKWCVWTVSVWIWVSKRQRDRSDERAQTGSHI